jgi:hypothetical protein
LKRLGDSAADEPGSRRSVRLAEKAARHEVLSETEDEDEDGIEFEFCWQEEF